MATSDISRSAFNPKKHYTSVRMQQGRVLMDDDWNENERIHEVEDQKARTDIIGLHGSTDDGFLISDVVEIPDQDGNSYIDFSIGKGTFYLEGKRIEVHEPESYRSQSDWQAWRRGLTDPVNVPTSERNDLVYLNVWEQTVNSIEDEELQEAALGGPDTSTRERLMRRVRIFTDTEVNCEDAWEAFKEDPQIKGRGQFNEASCRLVPDAGLKVSFDESVAIENLCQDSSQGGYLGAENQTIRVQIFDGNKFTWGVDNSSSLYRIKFDENDKSKIKVEADFKDVRHYPEKGQVIEILPASTELANDQLISDIQGHMTKIRDTNETDKDTFFIGELFPNVSNEWYNQEYYFMRIWDRGKGFDSPALIDIPNDSEIDLGRTGIKVSFKGDNLTSGNYWIFSVRPKTPNKIIPWDFTSADGRPPNGYAMYYAPLAIIKWTQKNGGFTGIVHDCRKKFKPLTEINCGCCIKVSSAHELREAIEELKDSCGGSICLCKGEHIIEGLLEISEAENIRISGENDTTALQLNVAGDPESGGIRISNCRNLVFERMKIFTDSAESLIQLFDQLNGSGNSGIEFHQVTFTNTLSNGIIFRMENCDEITIRDCALDGSIGIASLLNHQLAVVNNYDLEDFSNYTLKVIDFHELIVGAIFRHDDAFTCESTLGESKLTLIPRSQTIDPANLLTVKEDQNRKSLLLSNIWLDFEFGKPLAGLSIHVGRKYSKLQISINEKQETFDDILGVASKSFPEFNVRVTLDDDGETIQILIDELITHFGIGGEELSILSIAYIVQAEHNTTDCSLGVTGLTLQNSCLKFKDHGIFALKADRWNVSNCAFESNGSDDSVAISSFIWKDLHLENCTFNTYKGINIFFGSNVSMNNNTIVSYASAANCVWLEKTEIIGNHLQSGEAEALIFAFGNRIKIDNNQIKGIRGIENRAVISSIDLFDNLVDKALRLYGLDEGDDEHKRRAQYSLFYEGLCFFRLHEFIEECQKAILTISEIDFHILEPLIDVLLHDQFRSRILKDLSLPVIASKITSNTFDCEQSCISLSNFIPLGGLSITDNQLVSKNAQAIYVCTHPLGSDVHSLNAILRYIINKTIPELFNESDGEPINVTDIASFWINRFAKKIADASIMLKERVFELMKNSAHMLATDYQILGNTINSLRTAIETNIADISIQSNHITLTNHERVNSDLGSVINEVEAEDSTNPVAAALRNRCAGDIVRVHEELVLKSTLMQDNEYRESIGSVYEKASSNVKDSELKGILKDFSNALYTNDVAGIYDKLRSFEEYFTFSTNSFGIWYKGQNCKVSENRIFVSGMSDTEHWGRGGILLRQGQLMDEVPTKIHALFQLISIESDPSSSLPSTVVRNNTIMGGSGHGVDIFRMAHSPYAYTVEKKAYSTLLIDGNSILNMGGSGINIDTVAFISGIRLCHNRIESCGTSKDLFFMNATHSGIFIPNAKSVGLYDNDIHRCGIDSENEGGIVIFGCGGISECSSNRLLKNNGISLLVNNDYKIEDSSKSTSKLSADEQASPTKKQERTKEKRKSAISFIGNTINSIAVKSPNSILIRDVSDIVFNNNMCYSNGGILLEPLLNIIAVGNISFELIKIREPRMHREVAHNIPPHPEPESPSCCTRFKNCIKKIQLPWNPSQLDKKNHILDKLAEQQPYSDHKYVAIED